MDEAMAKSGEWPNVAIPAGSDPEDVMERYGVKPSVFDEPDGNRNAWRKKNAMDSLIVGAAIVVPVALAILIVVRG